MTSNAQEPRLCSNSGCLKIGTSCCTRCLGAFYCGHACQRENWSVHRRSCTITFDSYVGYCHTNLKLCEQCTKSTDRGCTSCHEPFCTLRCLRLHQGHSNGHCSKAPVVITPANYEVQAVNACKSGDAFRAFFGEWSYIHVWCKKQGLMASAQRIHPRCITVVEIRDTGVVNVRFCLAQQLPTMLDNIDASVVLGMQHRQDSYDPQSQLCLILTSADDPSGGSHLLVI